jgi:hypothetical protein
MLRFLLVLLLGWTGCRDDGGAHQRVLRVALPGQPAVLDTNKAYDAIAGFMLIQMREGLTYHDADVNVRPALAESWAFNDDLTEVTFTLRPNLQWSDGVPLAAHDFESCQGCQGRERRPASENGPYLVWTPSLMVPILESSAAGIDRGLNAPSAPPPGMPASSSPSAS